MALGAVLEQLGLTKKEAAVYLAALELGQSSVLRIAQKAAVKRPTAYVILETLQERGFVVSIPKGTTTLYQALDPDDLLRRFEEKVGTLKTALPEFKSLFNVAPGKPKVRFYEGKKNIMALYEEEIFRGGEVLSAFSPKAWRGAYSEEEMAGLLGLMKANGAALRDLLADSPEARGYLKEKNRLGIGETKFLPKNFSLGVDVLVYGNSVAMISFQNLIAVVIEDRAIAEAQRQFLEFLWGAIP
ncbi:MAG: helix-turn-helix domain-containing protein [bacterium]|nr:helix-turn-helix domain-containing protein [bacterium]MDZ4296516.1 helix-turn-helix domain-containing protein [Patescibacteria group bacterium]